MMQPFALLCGSLCFLSIITYGYYFSSQRFGRVLNKIGSVRAVTSARSVTSHKPFSIADDSNQSKASSILRCEKGNIVEFVNLKGTVNLGYVEKVSHKYLIEIRESEHNRVFTINPDKLRTVVKGTFTFKDCQDVGKQLKDLKSLSLEAVWENYTATSASRIEGREICRQLYGKDDDLDMFLFRKTMELFGEMYFKADLNQDGMFAPLPSHVVQENVRDRLALQEFRYRIMKVLMLKGQRAANSEDGNPDEVRLSIPLRIATVLSKYIEGLKQVVISSHSLAQFVSTPLDEAELSKGRELLKLLGMVGSAKNARKVLELLGIWKEHENIEKLVLGIQYRFPKEVIEDAYALLQSDKWVDPDERLRRDLTSLRTYAIDSEGTTEVDDALSIEYIDASVFHRIGYAQGSLDFVAGESSGNEEPRRVIEKLWVHIADVSAFIPPGSKLAQEAEERMTSIYLPDEKVGMLPDALSVDLLSLGAKPVSYALSLGVVLDDRGEVLSYEICPSKVRMTRRLTYNQLDDMLRQYEEISQGKTLDELTVPKLRQSSLLTTAEAEAMYDLTRLNYWALQRHEYRKKQGALDEYVKDVTNLNLLVRRDARMNNNNGNNPSRTPTFSASLSKRTTLNGYMSWANTTSVSLVSEYMILMAQTVGAICAKNNIPVWYKTQIVSPPVVADDLQVWANETAMLRSMRILRHLSAARDSYNVSGAHATSGSSAYVQCTSPLRRYHDLYNHYQLKVAMHMFSVRDEWHDDVEEELGYADWKTYMKTPQQKTERMQAIRLMQKTRQQYWMNIYLEKVVSSKPRVVFDCVLTSPPQTLQAYLNNTQETGGFIYSAAALQLGSHHKYALFYDPVALGITDVPKPGEIVRCHLFSWNRAGNHFVFIPLQLADGDVLPAALLPNPHV